MSMLRVRAEFANPITEADLKRAQLFNVELPAIAQVVAVEECLQDRETLNVSDPVDSWETWDDSDDMPLELGPDAEPIEPASPAPTTKLAIHGFNYEVRPIAVATECGTVAFELHKLDTNNRYHVRRDEFGVVSCDCPDYLMRHDGVGSCCKHGRRLVELGLMPAPAPIPTTLGRREFLTPKCSILANSTPRRLDYPARPRRFDPSPEEMAEAAQLFGDLMAERSAFTRELAEAL